jgi:hypothetical protein
LGGETFVGYFYRTHAPRPDGACVVMAHGFGGTQEGSLARNAADFAAAGLTALSFDYRSFGESGGTPRQVIDIHGQHADWRAAIACARALPGIRPDRIALWGSSLGGGHVLAVAAGDPTLAAVVAQVPFIRFPRRVEGLSPQQRKAIGRAAIADWIAGKRGRPPVYIKAVGHAGEVAVMPVEDAVRNIMAMDNPTWRNEVSPRALLDMAFWYRPGKTAHRLAMPVFLSVAEHDREAPAAFARQLVARAPRAELRAYPCRHFQFYDEDVRRIVLADQLSFLTTHLGGFPVRDAAA